MKVLRHLAPCRLCRTPCTALRNVCMLRRCWHRSRDVSMPRQQQADVRAALISTVRPAPSPHMRACSPQQTCQRSTLHTSHTSSPLTLLLCTSRRTAGDGSCADERQTADRRADARQTHCRRRTSVRLRKAGARQVSRRRMAGRVADGRMVWQWEDGSAPHDSARLRMTPLGSV